ncbi:Uncharacterised protein [Sphingobacterium daejeonense]|nr:Uncharacterised protein [Sphingobacterium daejeonense]
MCKRTLSVELEGFFGELGKKISCSVSAFSQQRSKLSPLFFLVWNRVLCESFLRHAPGDTRRWMGYRLIAVDGSNLALVNTPSLQANFGGQSNQNSSFVQAKTFYHYDVLNDLVTHACIAPYRTSELTLASHWIEELPVDSIAIYDRYYSTFKMFALHSWQESERKFVIRAKDSLEFVKRFLKTGKVSQVIELAPTQASISGLRQSGFATDSSTRIRIRLVRVELQSTTEVIATNLWQEEGFENDMFGDLYFRRWGVETNISKLKNTMQMESFSGLTVESVEQDFYATVMMSNLHSILIRDAQVQLDRDTSTKKVPPKGQREQILRKIKGKPDSHLFQKQGKGNPQGAHGLFPQGHIAHSKGKIIPKAA